MVVCFDAVRLFIFARRPYYLNTTTTYYFVTECSDIAVFVCLRVCHVTTLLYFIWPWPV